MKAHLIKDNTVVNTIEVTSVDFLPGLISAENGGRIGDLWDGVVFTPPSLPEPTNEEIKAQLMTADLKIIRALTEGAQDRIDAHKAAQAALRAQLKE